MIKYIVEKTHIFTWISAVIQVVLWINFIAVLFINYYLPTSEFFTEFYRNNLGLFRIQGLIMAVSPFIGIILSIISLFLDKQKAFAIIMLLINLVFASYILYLIMIVLLAFGGG